MSEVQAISVTQLARRVRNLLEIEIGEIWVEGEVSNLRKQASGHWYFSLKDESAQISCAMFGAKRRQGAEVIEDGSKVHLFGEVSFYEARGSTQLIVRKAQAVGVGDLQARFEKLKRELEKEGLFASERKKSLPYFPKTVGVITSPTGAALQDIKNVLSRRAPWLTLILFPVAVQGKGAENGIAHAIREAQRNGHCYSTPEVLIVGRGGGSLEDLWNFNEEVVARAIAESKIPVISAVGHEIDFTIADFVADLRAPTPSAAAELVAPDGEELRDRIERQSERVTRAVSERLSRLQERLSYLERGNLGKGAGKLLREPILRLDDSAREFEGEIEGRLREQEDRIRELQSNWKYYHPQEILKARAEKIAVRQERLEGALSNSLSKLSQRLKKQASLIEAYGPGKTLERGYSITFGENGEIVRTPEEVKPGERLETMLHGGTLVSRVEK